VTPKPLSCSPTTPIQIVTEARAWAELLMPVIIGLAIAGTGGWTAERWNTAMAVMGLGPAVKLGYEKGYATYNPSLREPGKDGQD